jgi:hypothetical protein
VLPADESLRDLDQRLSKLGKRKKLAKLTRDLGREHERIILDCPPVLNEISAQIMRAVDLLVVPLPPSPLSARALDLVTQELEQAGKTPPVILPVLSMVDLRRSLHRETKNGNPDCPLSHSAAQWNNARCGARRSGRSILPVRPPRQRPVYGLRSNGSFPEARQRRARPDHARSAGLNGRARFFPAIRRFSWTLRPWSARCCKHPARPLPRSAS